MRVDAHQHFWLLAERDGWPSPDMVAIYRDFQPPHLLPLLASHGIEATVLVQALPDENETRSMLALANQYPFIAAVVGWIDLKADLAPARIGQLATHPKLKGLRPMLQALDDNWLDDDRLEPAVEAMLFHNLSFDALVLPKQLPALLRFAQRYPQLPIVIDHAAKPPIAAAALQPWQDALAQCARLPQVMCKLSGLLTEAPDDCNAAILRPYVEHVLDVFTPQRVMWGSDWPVVNMASGYGKWNSLCTELLAHLTNVELDAVMGANATRFYRLG